MIQDRGWANEDASPRRDHDSASFLVSLDRGHDHMRREPLPVKHAHNLVLQPRQPPVETDQRLFGDVSQAKRSAFRQAVTFREDHDKILFVNHFAIKVQLVYGRTKKPNINLLPPQSLVLKIGKDIAALDFDVRASAVMFEYDLAGRASQSGRQTNAYQANFALLGMAGHIGGTASLHNHLARFVQKSVPGLREFDFTPVTHEQYDA